jgi:hypothetical protein
VEKKKPRKRSSMEESELNLKINPVKPGTYAIADLSTGFIGYPRRVSVTLNRVKRTITVKC